MVNLRTFDLNLLRIFEAVFHSQSVSQSAEKLGLTQPAVSNALDRLRGQLDDPLFIRTRDGMKPTAKALELSETVLNGLATIRAGLTSSSNFDPKSSVRRFSVLMTDVGEMAHLPIILSRLREEGPGIDLNVMEFGVERYDELLETGVADLAIGYIKLPDTLCSQEYHSSDYVVVVDRGNSIVRFGAAGCPYIDFEDYICAPHVQHASRGISGNPVTRALGTDAQRRRIALSIPHVSVLPMVLTGSQLVATVPRTCSDVLEYYTNLLVVPPPLRIERSSVALWWHRRNDRDPGHSWLRQLFVDLGS